MGIKFLLICFFSALLFIVILAPTFLSSPQGNTYLVSFLQNKVSGNFSVQDIELSWLGRQSFRGIKWEDQEQLVIVDAVEIESSLLHILFNRPNIGTVRFDNLNIRLKEAFGVNTVSGTISLEPQSTSANLQGFVQESSLNEPFSIQADIKNLHRHSLSGLAKSDFKMSVTNLPVELVEILTNKIRSELTGFGEELFGDRLNVEVNNSHQEGITEFFFKINSPGLQGHFTGSQTKNVFQLSEPGVISFTNKPLSIQIDSLKVPLERPEESTVAFSVKDFPIRWINKFYPLPFAEDVLGQFVSLKAFADPKSKETVLTLSSDKILPFHTTIHFDEEAEIPEKWIFSFSGQTEKERTYQGSVRFVEGDLKASIQAEKIPSIYFPKQVEGIFGETLNFTANTSLYGLNGPLSIQASGKTGNVHLDGILKNGALQLNQPLIAKVQGNLKLARLVLRDISPLLTTLESSQEPITFTFHPNGFSLPLFPFNANEVVIQHASLELGRLTFLNAGDLSEAISVLRPVSSEKITAWFTPIYFSLNKGLITLPRFDFLVMDRYPMASWGKIHLLKDDVDMVVGISGSAVNSALQLGLNDTDFMLQLPLKGSLNNAKLDTKKAAAKLTAIAAKSRGTPGGLLIGALLDLANGIFLRQDKIPPPTTNPLPWREKDVVEESVDSNKRKETAPLEKLEGAAGKILKKIFKP